MIKNTFQIFTDKNIKPTEFASLMSSVGWGTESAYDDQAIEQSLSAYPFIAHCRDSAGPRCQGSCRLSEMESGVGWGRKVDYRDETLLSRT